MSSFATTEVTIRPNGDVYPVGSPKANDGTVFRAGDVIRMVGDLVFPDQTILGFGNESTTWWVRLARPYVRVTGSGTTCPDPLTGVEVYTCEASHLVRRFKVVAHGFTAD